MGAPSTAAFKDERALAMRVAKTLLKKSDTAQAIEVLAVWASASNDPEGHKLMAEALRHGPDNPLAKAAFEKMEGLPSDQSQLEQARAKWTVPVMRKLDEASRKPVGGWQAEVGYNNNVKYRGKTYHIQTEDSGVKRPHILTHLFADGGRILKSYKREYYELLEESDLSTHVRAWMKGQHKEMFIALRQGDLDDIIEGRTSGGMEKRSGPPDPKIRGRKQGNEAHSKAAVKAATPAAQPAAEVKQPEPAPPPIAEAPAPKAEPQLKPVTYKPPPAAAAPPRPKAKPVRARLHVIRAFGDGPVVHSVREEAVTVGAQGTIQIVGDPCASAIHAAIEYKDGKLTIVDKESGNGTYLRVRAPVELEYGEHFIAGDQVLRVDPTPPPNDGPDGSPTYFYSSPKWTTTFRVVQVWGDGIDGACYVARTNAVQVGKANSDMNFATDFWLSDAHCMVEDQGGFIMLTDLGSRAGTFALVDEEVTLETGDEIMIGRTRLRVELLP